jgi:hypothetical protein
MAIATKNIWPYFQIFTYEIGMFSILHTKLICSMDHGECSDALFEVTRPIDDILWLNIRRCIYGALIPSRVKVSNTISAIEESWTWIWCTYMYSQRIDIECHYV